MTEEQDRLSALPDAILIDILSRLPIDCAAATALLSPRWRNLWKGVTSFKLVTLGRKFRTVCRILNCLTSPRIHVFDYTRIYSNDFSAEYDQLRQQSEAVKFCYHDLVCRQVEVIKLRSTFLCLPVPNSVFRCESLVVLELDAELDLALDFEEDNDVPVNLTIHLPNLKKLCLRLQESNNCLLKTLIKFCPLLEDLSLILDWVVQPFTLDIFAPNLQSLTINRDILDQAIGIDAPKSDKLKVSVEELPLLVPDYVFKCDTLVVLELGDPLRWKFESDKYDKPVDGTTFHLPKLKKLGLFEAWRPKAFPI